MKENALVVATDPDDTLAESTAVAVDRAVAELIERKQAAKPSPRGVMAHLEHPGGGRSLCGAAPARLRTCPACLARRAALLFVHVQSHKRPGRALCGLGLAGDAKRSAAEVAVFALNPAPGEPGWEPQPMYVSAVQAIRLLADGGDGLPVCPGCEINLMRAQAKLGDGGER